MSSPKEKNGCSCLFAILCLPFIAFYLGQDIREKEVQREELARELDVYNQVVKKQQAIRAAAEKGDPNAQFQLGRMYEPRKGKGIETSLVLNPYGPNEDINEAVKWYRKAADQGHKEAKNALKRLGY